MSHTMGRMQVLARASALLSDLAAAPGQGLDDLAASTRLPRATCARLLAVLAGLGWVEHAGRRRGWRLGPRAQAVAEGAPYRTRLLAAARPHLAAAAERLGQPVALSVLLGARRLVLERCAPDGRRDRRLEVDADADIAASLAGRLLLALQPPARRRRLCRILALPDPRRWPGLLDAGELADELRRLARERATTACRRRLAAAAIALPDGEGGFAALGTHGPPPGHPRAVAELRRAAARIAGALAG